MNIKRFPKPSLSPQQADGVFRSVSRRKSLIAKSDDAAELRGIKPNLAIKRVLKDIELEPDKEVYLRISRESKIFVDNLKNVVKKNKVKADVFIGGSYAKGTMPKKSCYDIDVFVRFDKKNKDISKELEKIMKEVCRKIKLSLQKVHGSRDYFKVKCGQDLVFEAIPVLKISKIKEAENVTDLSYFHVSYIKKHLKKNKLKEVLLTKRFCEAQRVYGAESYIQGFSGYGLECLMIAYGSFEKFLKEMIKTKEKIILDSAKHYKKKEDIKIALNESKIQSPVVLVDPTWKERNVLAALSEDSFKRFREAAKRFVARPSKEFFEVKDIEIGKLDSVAKKVGGEFVCVSIETDKQEGDIAGTKMKKFSNFLSEQLKRYFEVIKSDFNYGGGKIANAYFVVKSKKEIEIRGPPLKMKKHVARFRAGHKNAFEKEGRLYAKIKVDFSAKEFLEDLKRNYGLAIRGMGIENLNILN
ncbi:MAG: nucleotidyltransferase domain-containing protein [Nanoarchaeota archaeon]|nr:nucleotidyltransferase domain-containing protein [Nanoarchaeota archaeon]